MHYRKGRVTSRRLLGALVVTAGMLPLSQIHAQQILSQVISFDSLYVKQLQQSHMAKLDQPVVVMTPDAKTAQLTLTNPTDQELPVDLKLQYYTLETDTSGNWKSTVDSTPATSAPSLVNWVKGLPQHISLKPHGSETFTLTLDVPKSLPTGANAPSEYWARLAATAPTIKDQFPVVVRMMVADPAGPKLVQQPANGNMSIPLESHTVLLYHPHGSTSATLALGTPTATLTEYGQIRVCAPIQRTGSAGIRGRARVWIKTQGHDSLVLAQDFEMPAGSPDSASPCFNAPMPGPMTGDVSATLAIDPDQAKEPQAAKVAFAEVRGTAPVTLLPAETTASTPTTATAGASYEPQIAAGPLEQQIRKLATEAAKQGKVTLVEVGAPWCGPCQTFAHSLTDSLMIDALHDAQLVRINFNHWGGAFVNGVYKTPSALPTIFLVNPDGTPGQAFDVNNWASLANQYGTLDARAMAPPLKTFIAEAKAKQAKS
jgi:thiol-disulfide isomerase/thioredoxin